MNKKFLVVLALISFIFVRVSVAQEEPPDIVGWLNDTYYLENRVSDKGVEQTWKVNAVNGKSKLFSKQLLRDEINEKLPDGFRIRRASPLEKSNFLVFNQTMMYICFC